MPKAQFVKNIVIHCTAGFGDLESTIKYWEKTLGWSKPGYHLFIDYDGTIHQLAEFSEITNGVAGNNSDSIHVAYRGGVEKNGKDKNGQVIYKGVDTRTDEQKSSLKIAITRIQKWLSDYGKDISKDLGVPGHRDYSPDQDGNGIIAPFERIKVCPCFDALKEYEEFSSVDRRGILPTVKTVTFESFKIHVVVSGNTLSKIASIYKTTVQAIKTKNGLITDLITVGQKLKV